MSHRVYSETIKPINQCNLVGYESLVVSQRNGDERIVVLKDNFNQFRAILTDCKTNAIKSGILFDHTRTIRFKYTQERYRGNNNTAFIMSMLPFLTGLSFRHSNYLTVSGKAAIR